MGPKDLETLLVGWTLGDKLHYLAFLAPSDVRAIEQIVNDALRHRWPTIAPFTTRVLPTRENHF